MTRRALAALLAASTLSASCATAQSNVSHGSARIIQSTASARSHVRPPTTSGGGGPISIFTTPVITETSAAGTNPPTWDSTMADLQQGDTVQLDFTTNGSAPDGVAEESHTADSFNEAITWSTWTGFAGGTVLKWEQRYGRVINGTQQWSNWSNLLTDTTTNVTPFWVEETPPAGQNIAFGANSATFAAVHFGIGMGVVITATSDRLITGVTVNGAATTQVSQSSAGTKGVAIWRINETVAGNYNVVVSAASSLNHVAIVTGTMQPSSQTPSSVATPKVYGYTADPQALASITVPAGGIALCALTSENVTSGITWASPATQESNVVEGANSAGVRLTDAKETSTGACSLTGISSQGSGMVAAAWGP